jgi:hypothetical protein
LRVRAETFRVLPEVADEVAARVGAEPGVSDVKTGRLTGSLLIVYEPRQLQLPRLVQILVRVGGLRGIEVDSSAEWATQPTHGTRVRESLGALNQSLRKKTSGAVDLRAALPGTLAATGAAMFLAGRRRIPEWYDLIFWAFVTFSNLNRPDERVPGSDGDVDPS